MTGPQPALGVIAGHAAGPARTRRRRSAAMRYAGFPLASLLAGLAVWWALAVYLDTTLLPTPAEVVRQAGTLFGAGTLWTDIGSSVRRVVIGFVIGAGLAVPVGFVMGWYRWARGLLEPWVQFLRAIPALALIPFVVLAAGIGEQAKILVITIAAFLATVVGTVQGVTDVDRTLINAARVLGAPDRTIFTRVVIPASLPYILIGMRIGLGNAWATVVAAELIAASSGLGYLTQNAALYFQISSIFVAVICIGVIGVLMDRLILLGQARLTRWQERR